MALRVRGFVRIGAAMAGCVLVAACTPEPAPTVTPTPTPASVTPTETDIERQQRLDYEAAEKAYRGATWRSSDRQAQQGIAKKTDALVSEAVATDEYLAVCRSTVLESIREARLGAQMAQRTIVGYRARVGW